MRTRNKPKMFNNGEIWKEKVSDSYIWLGDHQSGKIQCYLAAIEVKPHETVFRKGDFWATATPTAIFDKFIKIL